MTLEALIREAADTRLASISLYRTADGWQANAKWPGSSGYRVCIAADPIEALTDVLGLRSEPAAPAAPKPSNSVFD